MKRRLKQKWIGALLCLTVSMQSLTSTPARADLFGGDVVVLSQILLNALEQLAQLRALLSAGEDTLSLLRDVNQGINDSLNLIRTINPNIDPGIYGSFRNVSQALGEITRLYGAVPRSKNENVQRDADQSASEAIAMGNQLYKYSEQLDLVGEQVKQASHFVSPAGAGKLTAQTLGVVLQVMNQSMRTQATSLKLQAQSLAISNKRDKDETDQFLKSSDTLKNAMKQERVSFEMPRF